MLKHSIVASIFTFIASLSLPSKATCEYEDVVSSCLANASEASIDSWRCEADVASCYMNVITGNTNYECGYHFYHSCGTVGGYICGWYDLVTPMIEELTQCNVQENRPDIDPVNPDPPPPVTIVTDSIPAPSECYYEDIVTACLDSVEGTEVSSSRCEIDVVDCFINVVLGDTTYECDYGFQQSCGTTGGYICGWYDVVGNMVSLLPACTPQENRPDLQ